MAFIGNNLGSITTEARTVDTMVGDGSTATMTLTKTPGSVNNVEVFYDGIFQTPGEDFTLAGSTLTFTTAPTTGINVVAISGDDSQVVFPDANSITTKKILDNTITSDKFVDVAVEKLSGTLPAVDGSAVTGMNLPDNVDVTTAASDPTRTTNKPVGSLAVNSTSGEMFICTDAETDNNTWMNVGLGNTDITYTPPHPYQGTAYGYTAGGHLNYSAIQRYSFTSDGNSTTTGNLILTTYQCEASQNATDGYVFRGYDWGGPSVRRMEIQKFSFASGGDAVNTGFVSLAQGTEYSQAYASSSTDGNYCYLAGGYGDVHGSRVKSIQSFSFTTNADTIDVGDLVSVMTFGWGWSYDNSYGYQAGGYIAAGNSNVIHKFSLAQSGLTASILASELTVARRGCYGQGVNSTTHGYCVGGQGSALATSSNVIDRMAFATDTGMVDHGDLHTGAHYGSAFSSSTTHGYCAGGNNNSSAKINMIQKFAYASNVTGSDVGDLVGTSSEDSGTIKATTGCHN